MTIEIQLAQDDFNFLGYKLGERLEKDQIDQQVQELQLRGLKDTSSFLSECVDWNMNIGEGSNKEVLLRTLSSSPTKFNLDQ